jgi:hypothetical protein
MRVTWMRTGMRMKKRLAMRLLAQPQNIVEKARIMSQLLVASGSGQRSIRNGNGRQQQLQTIGNRLRAVHGKVRSLAPLTQAGQSYPMVPMCGRSHPGHVAAAVSRELVGQEQANRDTLRLEASAEETLQVAVVVAPAVEPVVAQQAQAGFCWPMEHMCEGSSNNRAVAAPGAAQRADGVAAAAI